MRFWLGWEEKSQDYRPLTDPPNGAILGWWKSGEAGDGSHSTLCAWIDAENESAAKQAVILDWPGSPVWRFCNMPLAGFVPGDRFPLSDWMKKRAGVH